MSEFFSDLFFGKFAPYEKCVPNTLAYQEAEQQEKELTDELLNKLTPEQRKCYNEIEKISNRRVSMELEQSFSEGFRLACRMIFSGLQK